MWRGAPRLIALGVVLATLLAAAVGFSYDQRRLAEDRRAVADSAALVLEASLRETVERTETVAALYEVARGVSPSGFARFAAPLLNTSEAAAVLWVERVSDAERADFERRLGSPIVRLGPSGRLEPQVRRRAYDVVTRVRTREPTRSVVGLDVAAIPARAGTLRAAEAVRIPRTTPIVTLAGSRKPGMIVYAPVFDRRTGLLRGYASGAYRIDRLSAGIQAVLPAGTGVRLKQEGNVAMMSGSLSGGVHRSVTVAGQRWKLSVSSPWRSGLRSGPAALLLGLLALCALVAILLIRRARSSELIAEQRAAELDDAQRGRRATQQRLTTVFEQAPTGMAILGFDERFVRANRALEEITGYASADLIDTPLTDLVPEDHHDELHAAFASAAKNEEAAFIVEHPILDASGELRCVSMHVTTLNDSDGRPELMLAQIVDITDRRRIENHLKRDARYFGLSRDLICTAGFDGYFKQVNATWTRTLGWTERELYARTILEFVHPADRDHTRREAGTLLDGADAVNIVNRFRTKEGGWRWIEWNASVAPDEELVYAAARDITARVRAEFALEASEHRTRQILESAHDAFVSIDAGGIITDWNTEAETTFGWSRAEALGRLLSDTIIPRKLREAHRLGLERFHRYGEGSVTGQLLELTALHRSGREFPVELTILPVPAVEGHTFHAFLRDISERKHTQEELGAAHARALEASRLKSEFVANMSHEIRTPLNGVIGMSALLLHTPLTSEQRELADGVRVSGDALMAVITDVLDFSKIEAGKLEIESEPFEIRPIIDDVSSMVATAAHAKGLEIVSWIEPDLPSAVCGDGNRVRQILANLMTNAVKFTAHGEVTARLTAEPESDERVLLRFEVSDTGIGIDPASLDRVFDSFAQEEGSTTRRFGGTGLGLTISKQLVELMGGEIGVKSVPGEGSTFWFTVPAAISQGPPPARTLDRMDGARVLVVDDNALSLEFLRRRLESWKLECQTTADPAAALGLLEAAAEGGRPFSLTLIDSRMPGMSGEELTRAIRATPELGALKVLLLTTSGGARGAEHAGVDAFVTKPVSEPRLFRHVAQALDPEQPQASSPDVATTTGSLSLRRDAPLVLVAEDNEVNQRVATGMLQRCGFRVELAGDGHEALEMWEAEDYAAIFMDCEMPGLDGYQAAAAIRRSEGAEHHIPIIAMTANTMSGDRERCLAAGMDDYIGKPIRAERLQDVIARALPGSMSGLGLDDGSVSARGMARMAQMAHIAETAGNGDPADEEAPPIFEASLLSEVAAKDETACDELVKVFLDQAETRVEQLGEALAAGDRESVQKLAHGLKGSAAAVGALRLSQSSHRLCEAARGHELGDEEQLRVDVEQSFESTREALSPLTTDL